MGKAYIRVRRAVPRHRRAGFFKGDMCREAGGAAGWGEPTQQGGSANLHFYYVCRRCGRTCGSGTRTRRRKKCLPERSRTLGKNCPRVQEPHVPATPSASNSVSAAGRRKQFETPPSVAFRRPARHITRPADGRTNGPFSTILGAGCHDTRGRPKRHNSTHFALRGRNANGP